MNKKEALKAMIDGKKITKKIWEGGYLYIDDNLFLRDEDGDEYDDFSDIEDDGTFEIYENKFYYLYCPIFEDGDNYKCLPEDTYEAAQDVIKDQIGAGLKCVATKIVKIPFKHGEFDIEF